MKTPVFSRGTIAAFNHEMLSISRILTGGEGMKELLREKSSDELDLEYGGELMEEAARELREQHFLDEETKEAEAPG